jgi:hypothetical protein
MELTCCQLPLTAVCDAAGTPPAAPPRYTQPPPFEAARWSWHTASSLPPLTARCVLCSWHTDRQLPRPATPSRLLSRRPDGAGMLPAPSYLPALESLLRSKRGTQLPPCLLASLLHSEEDRGHGYFTTAHPKTQPRPNLDVKASYLIWAARGSQRHDQCAAPGGAGGGLLSCALH